MLTGSDYFITFTRSGEYHIISGELKMDYAREDLFSEDVPAPEDQFLEYNDAVDFAQEKGLEIYHTNSMLLIASFSDIQDSVRYYYGEDRDGNLYIGGTVCAYILDVNYEILVKARESVIEFTE